MDKNRLLKHTSVSCDFETYGEKKMEGGGVWGGHAELFTSNVATLSRKSFVFHQFHNCFDVVLLSAQYTTMSVL